MSQNQPIQSGLIGPPGFAAEGQPKPISYPNRIQDHHATLKFREIIDSHNALQTAQSQMVSQTQQNTATLNTLPKTFLTPNDINAQINIALGTNGAITAYVVKLLKASGVNVPDTLPPLT